MRLRRRLSHLKGQSHKIFYPLFFSYVKLYHICFDSRLFYTVISWKSHDTFPYFSELQSVPGALGRSLRISWCRPSRWRIWGCPCCRNSFSSTAWKYPNNTLRHKNMLSVEIDILILSWIGREQALRYKYFLQFAYELWFRKNFSVMSKIRIISIVWLLSMSYDL